MGGSIEEHEKVLSRQKSAEVKRGSDYINGNTINYN